MRQRGLLSGGRFARGSRADAIVVARLAAVLARPGWTPDATPLRPALPEHRQSASPDGGGEDVADRSTEPGRHRPGSGTPRGGDRVTPAGWQDDAGAADNAGRTDNAGPADNAGRAGGRADNAGRAGGRADNAGRSGGRADNAGRADDAAWPDLDGADYVRDGPPDTGRPSGRLVPGVLRESRFEVSRRAAIAVIAAALVAALVAGAWMWHTRPVTMPIVEPAGGVSTTIGAVPSTAGAGGGAPTSLGVDQPATTTPVGPPVGSSAVAGPITVAVIGRVRRPGVQRLPAGARVVDALRAAGGLQPGADSGLLNLAAPLSDGDEVVVAKPGATSQIVGPAPTGAGAGDPGTSGPAGTGAGGPGGSTAPVDLNAATAADLDTLPGVGPVTAQKILAWRAANGPFTSVDQLRDVGGIGDARFADLQRLVTV